MGKPFARSLAIAAAIAQAMTAINKSELLALIPTYKSRGKGKGGLPRSYGNKAGKYMPHQGKRECARRMRQLEVSA